MRTRNTRIYFSLYFIYNAVDDNIPHVRDNTEFIIEIYSCLTNGCKPNATNEFKPDNTKIGILKWVFVVVYLFTCFLLNSLYSKHWY